MQSRSSRGRMSKYDLTSARLSVDLSAMSETGCGTSMCRVEVSVMTSISDFGSDVTVCAGDMCIFQTS